MECTESVVDKRYSVRQGEKTCAALYPESDKWQGVSLYRIQIGGLLLQSPESVVVCVCEGSLVIHHMGDISTGIDITCYVGTVCATPYFYIDGIILLGHL